MSFRSIFKRLVGALAVSAASVLPAFSSDLTIVVGRDESSTEVYFSARGDVLFDVFDQSPALLTGDDEYIEFGGLSRGTFDAGDALLAKGDISIGGQSGVFEAMSMMVHPIQDKLPMQTPMDALIAIGVCNGPPAGTLIHVSGLQGYVGYFADRSAQDEGIRITFPANSADLTEVTVHDFSLGRKSLSYSVDVKADGSITLAPPEGTHPSLWLTAAGAGAGLGLLSLLTAVLLLPRRQLDPTSA
ncbi:MAG: hypothetical protein AAF943_08455 [Pseudomonadota bacterium]